jgi:choline kinase
MKYGGLLIESNLSVATQKIVFSDNKHYFYSFYSLGQNDELQLDFLEAYTIFAKSCPENADLVISLEGLNEPVFLNSQDALDVSGRASTVSTKSREPIHILVAGVRSSSARETRFQITKASQIKKVYKPWGHELWINSHNSQYSLKEVFIKQGRRTSLQYHNIKQETNVLFNGTANIWYKKHDSVSNDQVSDSDLDYASIEAVGMIDVEPKMLHRVQAVTDILLYEASTPHLDDVVRVQDDSKRKDGTIESEHQVQVCILAAGVGSRMGGLTDSFNKSLLPVKNKAILSGVIEKFPPNSKFVIGIGYKGNQVVEYVEAAYPDYDTTFVEIDNYDRSGSGPGYSLLQCKPQLREEPFYFTVSDAIYNFEIPLGLHENWVGVSRVNYAISHNYCNFTIEGCRIVDMENKRPYKNKHSKSFVGLAYVHSVDSFWRGIEDDYQSCGEHQMTNGIQSLIKEELLKPIDVDWIDVGSFEKYLDIYDKEEGFNFNKSDEYLYFVSDRVVKFFSNLEIVENRIRKAKMNEAVFPEIAYSGKHFYAYQFIQGETFYKKADTKCFLNFLTWIKTNLWEVETRDLSAECKAFYKDKTFGRIKLMLDKFPDISLSDNLVINGRECLPLERILNLINWDLIINTHVASPIHGDLQFDNIIVSDNDFTLIDWRQDFSGLIETGDLYYDLAKLYGGLIINYDLIKQGYFTYSENGVNKSFELLTRNSMRELIVILENFIVDEGYSLEKVQYLVGIIFLNMAPLHHYPFDKLLYSFGTYQLDQLCHDH